MHGAGFSLLVKRSHVCMSVRELMLDIKVERSAVCRRLWRWRLLSLFVFGVVNNGLVQNRTWNAHLGKVMSSYHRNASIIVTVDCRKRFVHESSVKQAHSPRQTVNSSI